MNRVSGVEVTRQSSVGRGVLAVISVLVLGWLSGCGAASVSAEREASAAADGITSVRIVYDSGTLEVIGQEGLTSVEAKGTAYATSRERLDDMRFVVRTSGTEIVIEARAPGSPVSHFDAVITVPASLSVIVEAGAGDLTVRDVASVDFSAGAGDITISAVATDVFVHNVGAGSLRISDVSGNVAVTQFGTGDIEITAVVGNVEVSDLGVGQVTVRDVGGDLTVRNIGVGSASYENVRGAVDVP